MRISLATQAIGTKTTPGQMSHCSLLDESNPQEARGEQTEILDSPTSLPRSNNQPTQPKPRLSPTSCFDIKLATATVPPRDLGLGQNSRLLDAFGDQPIDRSKIRESTTIEGQLAAGLTTVPIMCNNLKNIFYANGNKGGRDMLQATEDSPWRRRQPEAWLRKLVEVAVLLQGSYGTANAAQNARPRKHEPDSRVNVHTTTEIGQDGSHNTPKKGKYRRRNPPQVSFPQRHAA